MKLRNILSEIENERQDKTVLNSSPNTKAISKFHEVAQKITKILKSSRIVEKEQLHTEEVGGSLYNADMVRKTTLMQHLGEYDGKDLKSFSRKIAETFEKAGFKVQQGFGIDDIKGYEVFDEENEIVGEIDFIEKNSIPGLGNLIVLKHKKF
jgi:hypothetical protein